MKTDSDYLAFMRGELNRSKRWRVNKTNNYDEAWRRYISLYKGEHYDAKSGTDQLTVNLIFSTINTMAPAVAINYPKFVVKARKPEHAPQAVITEEVLNYMWRTHAYQREFRLAVDDWLLIGHSWLKVGYKWVKEPEVKPAESPTDISTKEEGGDEGIDDREDKKGNVESELNVDDDRPFVERISPFDMYMDPDARHPKEMRWIAQRTWRAVQDVNVDSRYSSTQRKRVSASHWSRWDSQDGDARTGSDSRKDVDKPDTGVIAFAEVIEFYDLKRNKVSTFSIDGSAGGEESGFLIKPEKMPYSFGSPFVMMRNYEIPDHLYPMGDVQQIESLQMELNETRNQMLNYRKKFRRAWIYAKDMFDRDGVQALESDEDNVMIPVMGDGDPSTALAPVPVAITPPEFFDQSAMISNDLDRVSGISDYQRGAQTAIKRTATEAAMIQDAANSRAQDRLAKIEGTLGELGERIIGLMQQYVTGDQVARIVTMPTDAWINYDSDRIQGQFDYEVGAGSTEPQNETFRRQSAMQLVDVSMPFMQAGFVNEPALLQELYSKGFGITDAARLIKTPEQMQQQQGPQQGPPPGPGGPQAGPPPGLQQAPPPGELPPQMTPQNPNGEQPQQIPPEIMEKILSQMPPEMLQAIMAQMPPGSSPMDIPIEIIQKLMQGQQGAPPQGAPAPMA